MLSRGKRLLRLRTQRGIEQQEAAPAIGISRPYLSLLERDQKGRNVDHLRGTLEKAARYYRVIPEYLLADTPQEYIKAFVAQIEAPSTFGLRLGLVLEELRLRWGDGWDNSTVAAAAGTTPEVLADYLADRVPITDSVAAQLATITGAPLEWLVPRPTAADDRSPALLRVLDMAVASGVQPDELQMLIQAWLVAKKTAKPPGA